MKKAFVKYLLSISVLVLGLVLTTTGAFSFSAAAISLPNAGLSLSQHQAHSTVQQVMTTIPEDGLELRCDLIVEETEVEENNQETDNNYAVTSKFLASVLSNWLDAYLSSLNSTRAKYSQTGHVFSSPLFITFRVLRL